MPRITLPIWVFIVIVVFSTCILLLFIAGISDLWTWIFDCMLLGIAAFLLLLLRFQKPEVLRRTMPSPTDFPGYQSYWVSILILAAVTAGLSVYDAQHTLLPPMPDFFSYIGMLLIFCGGILIFQTSSATPPHCQHYYGENNPNHEATGVYHLIRFPAQLSALLITVGISIYFMSLAGLVPALAQLFVLISFIRSQEEFRFTEYDWFFDYCKKVPFRLVPFIW
ncbi:MAG: methyltransferase [Christensenellales bacterium]|jgi:protein-S-isoprenylcysteine O-methyltransferase Ste14